MRRKVQQKKYHLSDR